MIQDLDMKGQGKKRQTQLHTAFKLELDLESNELRVVKTKELIALFREGVRLVAFVEKKTIRNG